MGNAQQNVREYHISTVKETSSKDPKGPKQEISSIEESQQNKPDKDVSDDLKTKESDNNPLWDDAIVPYIISDEVDDGLKELILKAVNEFNTKTPVQWIPYKKGHEHWVTFKQRNDDSCQASSIGKVSGEHFIWLPYPNYPKSDYKTGVICVMHEMMHILGFAHEMARKDANYHCKTNKHMSYSHNTAAFGAYDYRSIMHYRDGWGFEAKNDELHDLADNSETFSQGDLSMMRRIYGQMTWIKSGKEGLVHFGEWHKACTGDSCTQTTCSCHACGLLPGGVNCGYKGTKGHFSCCMNEDYESNCNATHTGFWHMACTDKRCTSKKCYCNSCGGGCNYEGSKAHWSCCNSENFKGKCLTPFY